MKIRKFLGIATLGLACLIQGSTTLSAKGRSIEAPADAVVALLSAVDPDAAAAPSSLFVKAGYKVEVYGGTAVGILRHSFKNETEDDARVVFTILAEARFEVTALGVESNGRFDELEMAGRTEASAEERQSPTPRRARNSGRSTASPAPRGGRAGTPSTSGSGPATPIAFESEAFEIPAGEQVDVITSFRTVLSFRNGMFKLTLPVTAVPRASGPAATGPMRIAVTVHHESPLLSVDSPSHEILTDFEGDRTVIEPVEREIQGTQPFEVEFAISPDERPTLAGYVRKSKDGFQELEAVLNPPVVPAAGTARAKQMLFVVDTSGSMRREDKLGQARRALATFLESLQPEDRFNIVEFDNDFHFLYEAPRALEAFGERDVSAWLEQLSADGSTTLKPALAAAIRQPADAERHRMIVLVTDGILQDEQAVLELLQKELDEGRLFVVGTGSRARHETLIRLAEYGRGAATFAGRPDQLEQAVSELLDSVSDPLAWDLEFDWDDASVEAVLPERLPDLYAGLPVRVLVKVEGEMPARVRVRMSTTDGPQVYTVRLPPTAAPR